MAINLCSHTHTHTHANSHIHCHLKFSHFSSDASHLLSPTHTYKYSSQPPAGSCSHAFLVIKCSSGHIWIHMKTSRHPVIHRVTLFRHFPTSFRVKFPFLFSRRRGPVQTLSEYVEHLWAECVCVCGCVRKREWERVHSVERVREGWVWEPRDERERHAESQLGDGWRLLGWTDRWSSAKLMNTHYSVVLSHHMTDATADQWVVYCMFIVM